MQSKLQIALSSPTFWTIVAGCAYNILAYVVPQLTGHTQDAVNIILTLLALYMHPGEVQKGA